VHTYDDVLAGKPAEIQPFLNERQWRLLLKAEARTLVGAGSRGWRRRLGSRRTRLGRAAGELESGVAPDGRVRSAGAGPPRARSLIRQ
jgi:hypothetical protein